MSYYDIPVRRRAPRGTFRPSPIFLAFVGIFLVGCVLAALNTASAQFNVFLIVVGGWLVTLCLHEFAHALVAYKAGDYGVIGRGYLQLNPAKYTHWLLSIVLPLLFIIAGGIALPGGAVLIDHGQVNSRWKDSLISLAGPIVNLLAMALIVVSFDIAHPDPFAPGAIWSGLAYLAFFQLMAGIFNLLPIPGLDGGNAIYPWLPRSWRNGFNLIRPYGFLLVMLLLWQSSFGQTMVNWIASTLTSFGIDGTFIGNGQDLFRFWR